MLTWTKSKIVSCGFFNSCVNFMLTLFYLSFVLFINFIYGSHYGLHLAFVALRFHVCSSSSFACI